ARVYYAEHLQTEGWFDREGWPIKKFFAADIDGGGEEANVVVGKNKFDTGAEWKQAYEDYLEYGRRNGLYLNPEELQKLKEVAALKAAGAWPKGKDPAGEERDRAVRARGYPSFEAAKLAGYGQYRDMTNIDAFIQQSNVERLTETVHARRDLFQA